MSYNYVF